MQSQQRQTAFKVRISDILNGNYVVQEGWEPNYVDFNGLKISRANIIGVIVSKQSEEAGTNESIMVDDGTGRILVRSFEGGNFSSVSVGDFVLLIGRPREYGNEIFVVPEIIKVLEDKKWAEVRKAEIGSRPVSETKEIEKQEVKEESIVNVKEKIKEEDNPAEKIIKCIKELDSGNGADFESVIKSYGDNAETLIKSLLERGEIFELKPGKLQVLE